MAGAGTVLGLVIGSTIGLAGTSPGWGLRLGTAPGANIGSGVFGVRVPGVKGSSPGLKGTMRFGLGNDRSGSSLRFGLSGGLVIGSGAGFAGTGFGRNGGINGSVGSNGGINGGSGSRNGRSPGFLLGGVNLGVGSAGRNGGINGSGSLNGNGFLGDGNGCRCGCGAGAGLTGEGGLAGVLLGVSAARASNESNCPAVSILRACGRRASSPRWLPTATLNRLATAFGTTRI